jgi:hypothetical protein
LNARITGVGRGGALEHIETGEIHSLREPEPAPITRLPNGPAAPASSPSIERPNAVAPLTAIIGAKLTTESPAWSGDPIPGMRLLQKTLVAASLELEQGERADLLTAIELVEKAVQMRLRWQQMRRSDAEGPIQTDIQTEREEKPCDPN